MGDIVIPIESVVESAWAYNSNYQLMFKQQTHKPRPHNIKWKPPNTSCFKVNFNEAMFDDTNEVEIGVVIQNSHVEVMASLSEKIHKPSLVTVLELLAARRAVLFVREIDLHQIVLEGDSEFVISSLMTGTNLSSMYGHLIKDVLSFVNSFQSFSLSFL